MHFVTFVRVYNMHQDTKSARLITVCKRTLSDVLPPLRSRVRALYRASDRTWEEFVDTAESRGISPGSPVSSDREKL